MDTTTIVWANQVSSINVVFTITTVTRCVITIDIRFGVFGAVQCLKFSNALHYTVNAIF
ncbi:hypothetical protein D3C87_1239320 [compost metagenome]